METMRVYEFSKICGVAAKELLLLLKQAGFDVSSHMSMLSDKELDFLRKKFSAPEATPMEKQPVKTKTPPAIKQPEISQKTEKTELKVEAKEPKPEKKKEPIIEEIVSTTSQPVEKKFEKNRLLDLHQRQAVPMGSCSVSRSRPSLSRSTPLLDSSPNLAVPRVGARMLTHARPAFAQTPRGLCRKARCGPPVCWPVPRRAWCPTFCA